MQDTLTRSIKALKKKNFSETGVVGDKKSPQPAFAGWGLTHLQIN
jgi:hypothetical protein